MINRKHPRGGGVLSINLFKRIFISLYTRLECHSRDRDSMSVYIYINMFVYMCMYIYMYIYETRVSLASQTLCRSRYPLARDRHSGVTALKSLLSRHSRLRALERLLPCANARCTTRQTKPRAVTCTRPLDCRQETGGRWVYNSPGVDRVPVVDPISVSANESEDIVGYIPSIARSLTLSVSFSRSFSLFRSPDAHSFCRAYSLCGLACF